MAADCALAAKGRTANADAEEGTLSPWPQGIETERLELANQA
jgi:hypothetical protein